MRTLVKTGLVVTTFATLVGCGGSKEPPRQATTETTGAHTETTTPAPQPPAETRPPMEMKPAEPPAAALEEAAKMTDGEILAITETANKGEVEMAELAKKHAASPDVKTFAVLMITSHEGAAKKEKTLAEKAKAAPVPSELSSHMKSEAQSTTASLKQHKGKDFDRAYMDAQVKAHRELLDTIDNKLMPEAENAEVKSHLTDLRRDVASHLAKAEDIQQKLRTGGTMGTPPAGGKKPPRK